MKKAQFGTPGVRLDPAWTSRMAGQAQKMGLPLPVFKGMLATLPGQAPEVYEKAFPGAMRFAVAAGATEGRGVSDVYALLMRNYPGQIGLRSDQTLAAMRTVSGSVEAHAANLAKFIGEAPGLGLGFEESLAFYGSQAEMIGASGRLPAGMRSFVEALSKRSRLLSRRYGMRGVDPRTGQITDFTDTMRSIFEMPEEEALKLMMGASPELKRRRARSMMRTLRRPEAQEKFWDVLAATEPERAGELTEEAYQEQISNAFAARTALKGEYEDVYGGLASMAMGSLFDTTGKKGAFYAAFVEPSWAARATGPWFAGRRRDIIQKRVGLAAHYLQEKYGRVDPQALAVGAYGSLFGMYSLGDVSEASMDQFVEGGVGAIEDERLRWFLEQSPARWKGLFAGEAAADEIRDARRRVSDSETPLNIGVQVNYSTAGSKLEQARIRTAQAFTVKMARQLIDGDQAAIYLLPQH